MITNHKNMIVEWSSPTYSLYHAHIDKYIANT